MHKRVQDVIKTLLAVSVITSQSLNEGQIKGHFEQELQELSQECETQLAELQKMEHEFETMDTLAFRQDDISTLTESLEATAKGLEDVNRRVK